ncbi:MAG: Glutamine-scyllo-inositol transaminase [Parcubacteria group bacterium GW2011_GWA2_42_28]|nr:MAG: Glutamine-scyllo-inositol transaminase [Parcubacteria group bacterium GW2011_GWA2_42_28]
MGKRTKKIEKINPNEFGGLLYDHQELDAVLHVLFDAKIFRYAGRKLSKVDRFENEIKKYLRVKYALGLNSGTSALKTALYAIGVKPHDRVLISAYTFIATAASVVNLGAIPIPIDFDMNNCMNLSILEQETNKGCTAIIPVHLQGRAFNIEPILKVARQHNIPVIEDACQAFASKYHDTPAGVFGDIGVYSFQQYKQISSGEGGLIVTNNENYYRRAKIYSDHGMVRELMSWDSTEAMIGDNLRINNLQAAILRVQLKKVSRLLVRQKKNRSYILSHIDSSNIKSIVNSGDIEGETGMNIMFLTSSAKIATGLIAHAKQRKIEFRRLWDRPYYKYDVFRVNKLTPEYLGSANCERAEDISQRLISLSISPTLSEDNLKNIVLEIKALLGLKYII